MHYQSLMKKPPPQRGGAPRLCLSSGTGNMRLGIAQHSSGQRLPRDEGYKRFDGHLRTRDIDEQAVACGCPGARVRLSKPCGSSARDLTAGARHERMDTITMGVLKMMHVPAEDRLHPRLLKQRHQCRYDRA